MTVTNQDKSNQNSKREFLISRGGPYYDLHRKLGLVSDAKLRIGIRALLLVVLTWGLPLVLCAIEGTAVGPAAEHPYLLQITVWARFFIAIALFILMEPQVEDRLRRILAQFFEAPILAPSVFQKAENIIADAIKKRNSILGELICLILAVLVTITNYNVKIDNGIISWAVEQSQNGAKLSLAGLLAIPISNTIFWFLVIRWLWRLFVWSTLLSSLSKLDMRLVATHPDGYGGLGFVGLYPNAFTLYIFAISCVLGAAIAEELLNGTIEINNYGYIMALWLIIVLALFIYPLLTFHKPLTNLKQKSIMKYDSQATRYHRAAEREMIGENITASEDAEAVPASEIPDPTKSIAILGKLSTILIRRQILLPVSAAALIPLVLAGASLLPIKELLQILKRLLLI